METASLISALSDYRTYDPDPASKPELQFWFDIVAANQDTTKITEIQTRMTSRLKFGTAGLRAKMGVGYDRMNQLTVLLATQGVLSHLWNTFGKEQVEQCGVCLGYDGRKNSKAFATITAAVFVAQNIPVFMFRDVIPTPVLAFSVLEKKAIAGITITASHNPAQDNGYKLYWRNGIQINSPNDVEIEEQIQKNPKPWKDYASYTYEELVKNPLVKDPTEEACSSYVEHCTKYRFRDLELNKKAVPVTYSAFHGVGAKMVAQVMDAFYLPPYIPVPEQIEPDGNFPTLAYPNPEEGKGALALPIKAAESHSSKIIFCNDPDADRFSVSEQTALGTWRMFNGNEIAVILSKWLWDHRDKNLPSASYAMVASTVSSAYLKSMAEKEGFHFHQTLTGFKNIGKKVNELQQIDHMKVLFAYEEAIGFMCATFVLDKDGVLTSAVMYELVDHVYSQGSTLASYLDNCYDVYGYHVSYNGYLICDDPAKLEDIFNAVRAKGYGTGFADATVSSVRDLTTGYDNSEPDQRATLPASSSSQFITFRLRTEQGSPLLVSLRGSGTEPKVKYYSEMVCSREDFVSGKALERLKTIVDEVIAQCLQPEANKLARPI